MNEKYYFQYSYIDEDKNGKDVRLDFTLERLDSEYVKFTGGKYAETVHLPKADAGILRHYKNHAERCRVIVALLTAEIAEAANERDDMFEAIGDVLEELTFDDSGFSWSEIAKKVVELYEGRSSNADQ